MRVTHLRSGRAQHPAGRRSTEQVPVRPSAGAAELSNCSVVRQCSVVAEDAELLRGLNTRGGEDGSDGRPERPSSATSRMSPPERRRTATARNPECEAERRSVVGQDGSDTRPHQPSTAMARAPDSAPQRPRIGAAEHRIGRPATSAADETALVTTSGGQDGSDAPPQRPSSASSRTPQHRASASAAQRRSGRAHLLSGVFD